MIFGLSLGDVVNAASGVLFLLTGALIVALAGGRQEVRVLGVTLAIWGLSTPVRYLSSASLSVLALDSALSVALLASALVVAWRYPTPAPRRDSIRLGAALAACIGWFMIAVSPSLRGPQVVAGWGKLPDLLVGVGAPPLATALSLATVAFLSAAFALRALTSPPDAPRLARLTLVFGLYGAYNAARIPVWLIQDFGQAGGVVWFHLSLYLLPVALWLVATRRQGHARLARNTALAVAAAALLGAALTAALTSDAVYQLGVPGALRTVSWAILALAILRHGLLGRALPRLAVSRGPAAAAALAALLIVAQVAQEFFAAQYGLVMGGIVAGALLFAASPIQRAFEAQRAGHVERAAPPSPRGRDEAEAAYRKALRIALRGPSLTLEEETHLHELAEHLGIGAGRAHALFVEVKREMEA